MRDISRNHPDRAVSRRRPRSALFAAAFVLLLGAVIAFTDPGRAASRSASATAESQAVTLTVRASAYNSVPSQTTGNPSIAAWGDRLEPGMRAIAVSADLLDLGLDHGTQVTIEGLPGTWVVLDRMPSRWKQRIDIYMGQDVKRALQWGVQRVKIRWDPEAPPANVVSSSG